MQDALILSCVRSPVAKAQRGAFARTRIDDIAEQVVRAAIARVPGLDPALIEDVLIGCAMPEAEQGYNVARNISFLAGLPEGAAAVTVNRFCASSLEAVVQAARAVRCGDGELFVAGGVESMTAVPIGGFNPNLNGRLAREGMPDAYISMGLTAENVARAHGVSREDQDRFALMSHRKALAAQAHGAFSAEIAPVTALAADGGAATIDRDEGPRQDTSLAALAALAPAFREGGSVTAGNSSQVSDGAAIAVIASKSHARKIGARPMAKIRAAAVAGVAPEFMGMGPAKAVPRALARAGMRLADIDLVELNEAFASQAVACARELAIDERRLNVHGGAIALGHPLGASGARILATLVHAMIERGASTGLAAMCVGGGQGMAIVVERT
ncbi:MAG: thiolase family protein [Proteobacteria bacterium]|nr:thiolase family protein [Pseudomonadota bacterium]